MFSTTIKHVKQFILMLCAISIIIPSELVAKVDTAPKSAFEKGLDAKKAAKWKQAQIFFESIKVGDPNYDNALNELGEISRLKSSDQETRRDQHQAKVLIEKLDQGAEKCTKLFSVDGSPEVYNCIQELSELQKQASDKLKADQYEHPALKTLNKQLEPYKEFDVVALPVTKEKPRATREDMDKAAEKLVALNQYIQDAAKPAVLRALGQFVVAQFSLGAALAFAESCRVLREEGDGQRKAAIQICGYAEDWRSKYSNILPNIDSGNLVGRQIPSLAYKKFAPIDTEKHLPKPDIVKIANAIEPGPAKPKVVKEEQPAPKAQTAPEPEASSEPEQEQDPDAEPVQAKKTVKKKKIVKKRVKTEQAASADTSWVTTAMYVAVPVVVAAATAMWFFKKAPEGVNPGPIALAVQVGTVLLRHGREQLEVSQDVAAKVEQLNALIREWAASRGALNCLAAVQQAAGFLGVTVGQGGGGTAPYLTATAMAVASDPRLAAYLVSVISSIQLERARK